MHMLMDVCSHGINLHYTAGETNRWIQSHLASL
jgi:hypothetical protein